MNLGDRLLRVTRSLLLLLLLVSLAISLLRGAILRGGHSFDLILGFGLVIFVLWRLGRGLKQLRGRSRREAPARPDLPGRSQWVGPRTREQEERRR
jgi:hypothetical protein